ncbi:MAG: ABC transporter ATP-binding protein [Candidatus Magasanikbacteria bacterium]|nr:ABC transporter ATP-binding protein [Candidatus Magasanikbacteria bacterium]
MKYNTKLTFKIFWKHALRYKWSAFFTLFCIAIGDAFSVAAPYWYKIFFDELVAKPPVNTLFHTLFIIFLILIAHWLFIRISAFTNSFFQTSVMRDLSDTCFVYLHKHSFSFFNNSFVGSLVKRVNRFSRAFEGVADRIIWDLFPIFINILFIIIVLAWRKPILGLIVFVWIILFCICNYAFSMYKLTYDVKRSELDTKATGILADTITNNVNVKLFVGYDRERTRFSDVMTELTALRRFTWDLGGIFDSVQWLLMTLLEVGMMYVAIKLWAQGFLTLGDFVLIQAFIMRIFEKLWGFGRMIRDFYENLADAEEMTEILDTPHEIIDIKNAKELKIDSGEIIFDHVNFSYHKTRKIFSNLHLHIRPQQKVGLVGPSGAGKSTIVKLLLRQHDISRGTILIDGQSVSRVTQESLWKNISLVPQDPILFHRTLMENIRYGKPEATDAEVIEASRLAHCHEFIFEFPNQYDTYVGERGVKLSGGERQRVAIARAILRNAPILVLDEATSSLDSESEHLIQDALDKLMKGKTVIVIAHRLSTIMRMDRIVVVDKGKIIEDGTHTQLLRKTKGLYKKLWSFQKNSNLSTPTLDTTAQ